MDKEEEITYWSIQLHAYETLLKALKKQNLATRLTADDIIEGYIPTAIEVTKEQLERITNDHKVAN